MDHSHVPDDVWVLIFSLLSVEGIPHIARVILLSIIVLTVCKVCKLWSELVKDELIWRRFFLTKYPSHSSTEAGSFRELYRSLRRNWRNGVYKSRKLAEAHTSDILRMVYDEDIVITGSLDNTAALWNCETNEHYRVATHADWVTVCEFVC